MYLTTNQEEGVWKLIPTNLSEEAFNAFVPTVLEPKNKFVYNGRMTDPENKNFLAISVRAVKEIRERKFNWYFWKNWLPVFWYYTTKQIGEARDLVIVGSEPQDKFVVSHMRNSIFFSGFSNGGLYFVRAEEINNKVVLYVCSNFCSRCNKGTIGVRESEYRVCDSCALECVHVFNEGYAHAPGIELATALVCQKCGVVNQKVPMNIISVST